MASQTFASNGTFSWQAPVGVTSVQAECWGAGASGAGSSTGVGATGGGGGGYSRTNSIGATAGNNYTVTVGKGGVALTANSAGAAGQAGTDTSFVGDSLSCVGKGAAGFSPGAASGPGGVLGTGVDARLTGGNGGVGGTNKGGGGGGSSAGTAANGGNGGGGIALGAGGAGGTAPSGGGGGGHGGAATSNALLAGGSTPGGGGGAGGVKSSTGNAGASGADGQVILTWTASGGTEPTPYFYQQLVGGGGF